MDFQSIRSILPDLALHNKCSYEHYLCHPFIVPAAPALRPCGKSSTTPGANSSPPTNTAIARPTVPSAPTRSPSSIASTAAATFPPASPVFSAPIAATKSSSPSSRGCGSRLFCPSCHQRRVRSTGHWIAHTLCHQVPHRQFVFTIPRPLRGIFRKRRHLLDLLFRTSIETLRDWFRTRLDLPGGQLAAIAAVQTFGDYLVFHPHLHVLAATGLYDREGTFHELPVESIEPLGELFRHRFLAVLRAEKLISEKKLRQLLAWKHSGFSLDAGTRPVRTAVGRQKLAEYLLRAPFSLEKITWIEKTKRVIYRSRTSWRTKRNFQVFTAADFIAAAVEHIPPKNQHTIRYYGRYSNKSRGLEVQPWKPTVDPAAPHTVPAPPKRSARNLRPLWRHLILRVWCTDPLICPCCKGLMRPRGRLQRPEEIQFFLQLHGLWEGIIDIPPPPDPPYDIDTMEPLSCPFERLLERRPAAAGRASSGVRSYDTEWQAPELPLDDERILVLDADPPPPDDILWERAGFSRPVGNPAARS